MIWDSGWDVSCNIFALISIIGPLCLVGWYFKDAKERFQKLNQEGKEKE
mgnify:FL=1